VRVDRDVSGKTLAAAIAAAAAREGRNPTGWPGLTIHRLGAPGHTTVDSHDALTVCVIAQPAEGTGLRPLTCAVVDHGRDLIPWTTAASARTPMFLLVLHLDPQLVLSVAAAGRIRLPKSDGSSGDGIVDANLADSVMRFLHSVPDPADRRALAPLYLQEVIYRLLQGGHGRRLLQLADQQAARQPVAAALAYIAGNLAAPLTVDMLAAQVNLSPSAFSRTFRQVTGRPPYQYLKDARLEKARFLLETGRYAGVADVARAVGYASVSHFIKEFRARYDSTPGGYLETQRFDRDDRIVPVA